MKKTLRLRVPATSIADVEVTLPFYRKHVIDLDECGSATYYQRINKDMSKDEVIDRRGSNAGYNISRQRDYRFGDDATDYNLGRGDYACTAYEFEAAVYRANSLLASLMAKGEGAYTAAHPDGGPVGLE